MKNNPNKVKFTTQVIKEKTAKRGWWVGLFDDKHSAAKAKERAIAGTLSYETVKKMMKHFKMKCVQEPLEALWEELQPITWKIYDDGQLINTVTAETKDEAIAIASKAKYGETTTFVDQKGRERFIWELNACDMTAEEAI